MMTTRFNAKRDFRTPLMAAGACLLFGVALAPAPASAATNLVRMVNYAFQPKFLTNHVGDTVLWTNITTTAHNTVSSNGVWSSSLFLRPGTFPFKFTTPGVYGYYCQPHINLGMVGIIYVQGAANTPPTVAITNPPAGATFTAPANVTLAAAAADSDGTVVSVEFFANGNSVGTATSEPYSLAWDSVPAGTYTLTARATDDDGATATSAEVMITVNPPQNVPPSVVLTNPPAGATFTAPANVTLAAAAADSDGTVVSVEFFANGNSVGTTTSEPYSLAWDNVPAGTYTLTARATDNDGATATSAEVMITVNPPQNVPPSVVLTNPPAGATFTAPAAFTLQATASDSDGSVTNVQFFRGAALLGAVASPPFQVAVSNLAAATYDFTARAFDNMGVMSTSAVASVSVADLRFGPPAPFADSEFPLTLLLTPGFSYSVETSTDLNAWDTVTNFTAASDTVTVTVPVSGGEHRFFRARVLPNP